MNLTIFIPFAFYSVSGMGNVEAFASQTSRLTTPQWMHSAIELTLHYDESDNTTLKSEHKVSENVRNLRREILSILGGSFLYPLITNADEPSNINYKSRADEEDPLEVFGKTLQNMSFENTAINNVKKDEPPSSSDMSVPSFLPQATEGGGDLNKALQEKKLEQKRRVDPRTHG